MSSKSKALPGATVGIDLGTTYSAVAIMRHGKVELIANDVGSRTTPSYVAFNDTDRLIGDAAKSQVALNPKNTIFDAKRLIGRKFSDPSLQSDIKHWPFAVESDDAGLPRIVAQYRGERKSFSPEEISAMILTKMKATAETYLGEPVANAVITVPAYFNDAQRQSTRDAGRIAGLNVLRLVNEPTAAALAYGLGRTESGEDKTILVFDLGGGTFDVSLLSVCDDIFEVLATAGDTHLGGEDFDNRLVSHFAAEFKRKEGKDLTANPRSLRRLRTACERAKRTLSSAVSATIEIDSLYEGIDFHSSLSRARFEELCGDLFRACLGPVGSVLRDAKRSKADIDEVVLVGGSTRIPKVRALLSNFFNGKALSHAINPDEAVAYGAAVQGGVLTGQPGTEKAVLIDVTPLSLGIEVKGGMMAKIIERNQSIPVSRSQTFSTAVDGQPAVTIQVFQGERAFTKDNSRLGTFTLGGLPPDMPAGRPKIEVSLSIDRDGLLKVSAKESSSGVEKSVEIERHGHGGLSQADVLAAQKAEQRYREADALEVRRVESRNRLESALLGARRGAAGDALEAVRRGLRWVEENQAASTEEYEAKLRELGETVGKAPGAESAEFGRAAGTTAGRVHIDEVDD